MLVRKGREVRPKELASPDWVARGRLLLPLCVVRAELKSKRNPMQRFHVVFLALVCWSAGVFAQDSGNLLNSLPSYMPEQQVIGTIRIWGNDQADKIVNYWEEGFRKRHPGIHFETSLRGTASAIGGLYTGAADVALTGSDVWPIDIEGFDETFHYKPFGIEVFTGSLDVPDRDFALGIFVHKDNPISHLTLTQLDAIFGGEHRRGTKNIRTWGELGLTGEWAEKTIHVYGFGVSSRGLASFFEDAVMVGSFKWNCDMQEVSDLRQPDGSLTDAGQRIVDTVAKDRYGIGYSGLVYENPIARTVALAPAMTKDRYGIAYSSQLYKNQLSRPLALVPQDSGPYFRPTKENVMQRKYPLTRTISIFINRAPGTPIDPKLREYLRYILSREGQEAVVRDGGYLPLNQDAVRIERKKLE